MVMVTVSSVTVEVAFTAVNPAKVSLAVVGGVTDLKDTP